MWILILLDHRGRHVNSFQPTCFSSSASSHFNIRKINSKLFSTVFIPSVTSCLCFPTLPPFFLKHSEVLTKYPFYSREVPSFFSINVLTRWLSWRCSSNVFLMQVYLLLTRLSLSMCFGVLKISQEIRVFIQDLFKLFRGCYLIQAI